MDASFAESLACTCSSCGHAFTAQLWSCVDLEYRPQDRALMGSPEFYMAACPSCGVQGERAHPLVVIRLTPAAPVIVAIPTADIGAEGQAATNDALVSVAYRRLGLAADQVPGPYLVAPFMVVGIASQRDPAADATRFKGTGELAGLEGSEVGIYTVFLHHILETEQQREAGRSVFQLNRVSSREDIDEFASTFDASVFQEVNDLLERLANEANDDEGMRIEVTARRAALAAIHDGDLDMAWSRLESGFREAAEALGQRFSELSAAIEAAADPESVSQLGYELLDLVERAPGGGLEVTALVIVAERRLAHIWAAGPEYTQDTITYLERAIELAEGLADPSTQDQVLSLTHNLAVATSARGGKDPAYTQTRAIDLLRKVLESEFAERDRAAWSTAKMNLGRVITELAEVRRADAPSEEHELEPGGVNDLLLEAQGHIEDALRERPIDQGVIDWGYATLNLGATLTKFEPRTAKRSTDALSHFEAVYAQLVSNGGEASQLKALAAHNMADVLMHLASNAGGDEERRRLLSRAKVVAQEAAPIAERGGDKVLGARLLRRFARATEELDGYCDEACDAYLVSARGLMDEAEFRDCRDVARRVAALAAERGDWDRAAEAWGVCAQAARSAIDLRASLAGKLAEARQSINTFRFGAYSLIRGRRLAEAVEMLEQGRARLLANWMGETGYDKVLLRATSPDVANRLDDAIQSVRQVEAMIRAGDPLPPDEPGASNDELIAAVETARELPGFQGLWRDSSLSEIQGAIPVDEAIVYLLTSPVGSAALFVSAQDVSSVELDISSTQAAPLFFSPESGTGYLPAVTLGIGDLDEAIGELESALGERVMRPVATQLAELGVGTACLVPVGPLAYAPLHTLHWSSGTKRRCLLDGFSVVFAPSAHARSVARRRAESKAHALGGAGVVGNPLPSPLPLPSAEWEAAAVAEMMPSVATTLIGTEATKAATLEAIKSKELLHLACHGESSPSGESLDSALVMAGGERLTGGDLLAIEEFKPRLVVASACETAVVTSYDEVDESLSLATVMLGAGAVGAVASLWRVPDLETAALMTRFWLGFLDGLRPERALREAQLWLRDLTHEEFCEFVAANDNLLRIAESSNRDSEARPMAHRPRSSWSAFVLSGA